MQTGSRVINPLCEQPINVTQRTRGVDWVDEGVSVSELQHPIASTLRS